MGYIGTLKRSSQAKAPLSLPGVQVGFRDWLASVISLGEILPVPSEI